MPGKVRGRQFAVQGRLGCARCRAAQVTSHRPSFPGRHAPCFSVSARRRQWQPRWRRPRPPGEGGRDSCPPCCGKLGVETDELLSAATSELTGLPPRQLPGCRARAAGQITQLLRCWVTAALCNQDSCRRSSGQVPRAQVSVSPCLLPAACARCRWVSQPSTAVHAHVRGKRRRQQQRRGCQVK